MPKIELAPAPPPGGLKISFDFPRLFPSCFLSTDRVLTCQYAASTDADGSWLRAWLRPGSRRREDEWRGANLPDPSRPPSLTGTGKLPGPPAAAPSAAQCIIAVVVSDLKFACSTQLVQWRPWLSRRWSHTLLTLPPYCPEFAHFPPLGQHRSPSPDRMWRVPNDSSRHQRRTCWLPVQDKPRTFFFRGRFPFRWTNRLYMCVASSHLAANIQHNVRDMSSCPRRRQVLAGLAHSTHSLLPLNIADFFFLSVPWVCAVRTLHSIIMAELLRASLKIKGATDDSPAQ